MADTVIETFPLGFHWPMLDPFLFCAHHRDAYPEGNEAMAPVASLEGRELGEDFSGLDGWSMYHGRTVPGFPQHPHRGFETVTYVRQGLIDHADSMGATARYGRGDVQWLTAGGGFVHSEMFPLVRTDGPNPLELFQIWVNLPREHKMVEGHFTMLWAPDIPKVAVTDSAGRATEVTVIAGALGEATPPSPPPHSWGARHDADVAIWHVRSEAGAEWELPAARVAGVVRTVYVFAGDAVTIDGEEVRAGTGAVVRSERAAALVGGAGETDALVLQGRPINEPVAQYGPFVMNDRAGIQEAISDYQRTQFGGWPWPVDGPVHPRESGRFALLPDGRREEPVERAPEAAGG